MRIYSKAISFGLVFIAIAAGSLLLTVQHSSWSPGTATVQRVTKQCKMESTERGVLNKTTYSAEIDCGDVGAFEMIHADKTWRSTPIYTGRVSVERDGTTTTTEMPLSAGSSGEPKAGDTFAVLQDPSDPDNVSLASQSGTYPFVAIGAGLAGAFCFWLGFGAPMPRRNRSIAVPDYSQPSIDPNSRPSAPTPDTVSPPAPVRTTYVPPPRQPAIISGRRTFGRRGAV